MTYFKLIERDELPWKQDAVCRGMNPAIFHPAPGADQRHLKAICVECPVRLDCLDYAISANELFGFWGGMSERERRRERSRRRRLDTRSVA